MINVREELFKNQDTKYREFHSRLIPDVDKEKIIGVRVPAMRKIAKQAAKDNADFAVEYYEEAMIKGFVVGYKSCSLEEHLQSLADFVPYIDNWAVCDCSVATFKFAKKYQSEVWDFLMPYFEGGTYEIRFAVIMLMDYYLNDEYIERVIDILKNIESDEYYVNMAVAWALSVVYVKYKEKALALIESKCLKPWVHNKTIQKICESLRVDKTEKEYLKKLKV